MNVRVGSQRKLSTRELMLLNCGARKDSWESRRSNQSILKEINPEYSLEGLILKLKLQYFGHLMWRVSSLEKPLMLGKSWRQEEKGWQRTRWVAWHHRLSWHEFGQTLGDGEGQGSPVCCSPCSHRVGCDLMTEHYHHQQQQKHTVFNFA